MIRLVIDSYIFLIIIDAVVSYIPQAKFHPLAKKLRMVTDFTQKPLRSHLPMDLPFDPSPIIVILLLNLIKVLW